MTTKEKMLAALKTLHRLYSTWAVFLFNTALLYWLQLPVERQAELLARWPSMAVLVPISGFVAFALARIAPQKIVDDSGKV